MKTKLAGIFLFAAMAAVAHDVPENGRVRAEPPTVVTVRATSEQVRTQGQPKECRRARAWNRLVGFAGWALNADDDIPSARERRQADRKRTQPVEAVTHAAR